MKFAAIDIGTNSINLLISDENGNDLYRENCVVRLGEDLNVSGQLSFDAIERTLSQIRKYKTLIDEHSVDQWHAVITAPGRLAKNIDTFTALLESEIGNRFEIASGEREAQLSYNGVASLIPSPTISTLTIDIGGGSTEFAFAIGDRFQAVSIPVGALSITAKHLVSDPPRPEELTNAIGEVQDHLDDVLRELPEAKTAKLVIGSAGTIVTIAAIEIGLTQFEAAQLQGFALSRDAAEDVFRTLATEKLSDRKLNPGLPAERADVIVGGCCVLVAIMRRFHLDELTISVRNLLDGVIAELRTRS